MLAKIILQIHWQHIVFMWFKVLELSYIGNWWFAMHGRQEAEVGQTMLNWHRCIQSISLITVYTFKQTGLTCAGPQKCASVNVVLIKNSALDRHTYTSKELNWCNQHAATQENRHFVVSVCMMWCASQHRCRNIFWMGGAIGKTI